MITNIYLRIVALTLLSLHVLATHAEEQKVGIEIGISPFLPVKTLVQNYAPLREYLQNQFKEPVTIVSAPDYKTFYLGYTSMNTLSLFQLRIWPILPGLILGTSHCCSRLILRNL